MVKGVLSQAQGLKEQLVAWRRTIHARPGLGFDVQPTADLVANEMERLGLAVQRGVGKTGVVGILGQGKSPAIAIRADMDALPIQEENDVPYISQIPGCMHACGHDAHTAMLLGAATMLSRLNLPGQVRFLFQPSEEVSDPHGMSGANYMIADGALKGVDAVIALHVDAEQDTGKIEVSEGYANAAADSFTAHISGRGGHGAHPHECLDPIWLASQVLNAIYAVPSRRTGPLRPAVISVGSIQGGSAENVIPDTVTITGTLRSVDDKVRAQLVQELESALSISRIFGGDYSLDIHYGSPAIYNDPDVARLFQHVGFDLLGEENVLQGHITMGGEDFSLMAREAKGAMFSLGVRKPGTTTRFLHTATFDMDEDALPIGSALLAEAACRFLEDGLATK